VKTSHLTFTTTGILLTEHAFWVQ